VDVINSLLHASNHFNSASQAAVLKGKFCCLGRERKLKLKYYLKENEVNKEKDQPQEGQR